MQTENPIDFESEWLETDGLGGFASGTVGGHRSRRYHALLTAATTPPTGRVVLVNGLEIHVECNGRRSMMSRQDYFAGIRQEDANVRLHSFSRDPWPTWLFKLPNGETITQEFLMCFSRSQVVLRWRYSGSHAATLNVRPLISGRDYHALHRENPLLDFSATYEGPSIIWQPYSAHPAVRASTNGAYRHQPEWYRQFTYRQEQERGFDHIEDLASPGVISWCLSGQDAVLIMGAGGFENASASDDPVTFANAILENERDRRSRFATSLQRAADAYIVQRGDGKSIIAGYPWFTDWGRDTFIAIRGLCIATGRLEDAESILVRWAKEVSEGMLPNRFPDAGEVPEFNAVDASLWFVVAVHEFLQACERSRLGRSPESREILRRAVLAIVSGYSSGTRYRIQQDRDGLLSCGVEGVQLTWMDAKVGDHVVTPRIGKPVEVQALWINALQIAGALDRRWLGSADKARRAFFERFLNPRTGWLFDVVDVNHVSGNVDSTFRPNQIFAVGGLPFSIVSRDAAARIVSAVEARLLTPIGLRSLAPGEPGFRRRYEGDVVERDSAYHQGTVWPWLIGPFVEAWLRVRSFDGDACAEAQRRFIRPIVDHLDSAGLGHVSEITDADSPHTPRGCPFQAWSVGELLRLMSMIADPEGNSSTAPECAWKLPEREFPFSEEILQ